MDLSLWDPPICEDESSDFGENFGENWWSSDFYNGYGFFDVMEEDALNAQACKQVLEITFSKAESDIVEVEEEVAVLQSELASADEVWSKKHTVLTERINSVQASIERYKIDEPTEHPPDFDFQTLWERAEKLSALLKTLLESYSSKKDVQNLSPNIEKLPASQSKEKTQLSNLEAAACGSKILEETVGPLYKADQTRDVKKKDQNGDATSSDLITNSCRNATDVPSLLEMDKVNASIHLELNTTENQDSTTKAEKRMNTTEVDKHVNAVMINKSAGTVSWEAGSNCIKGDCNNSEEKAGGLVVKSFKIESITSKPKETTTAEADMVGDTTSGCMQDAAKQMTKESILKRKLNTQEDASRTNLMNTRKQLVTEKMITEYPPKMKQETSDSERTIEESIEELLRNRRREKAQIVHRLQNTEVVGKEPPKSNLLLKSESPIQREKLFPNNSSVDREPSLAMEIEMRLSSIKNFERNILSRFPNIHAGKNSGCQKTDKGTHLNLEGDKSNTVTADVNLGSTEKGNKSPASPSTEKNVELKNLQVNAKKDEDVTTSSIKEHEEVCKDEPVNPARLLPGSTSVGAIDSLSLAQLRAKARERKVKNYSKFKKEELFKLLG